MREKKRERHDVVIIGGGGAGLTAAIYCGRARLKTLLIEKGLIGGLATYTHEIENYPGFPEGTTGLGLMEKFHAQAKKFGVQFKGTDVKEVNFTGEWKEVHTFRNIFESRAVIVASGGRPRVTGARNEKEYLFDKGISFCATCDAAANEGKTVMIIGSGDAAIEEGMFLAKFAKKVIVSVIHDEGKMDCNEIAREQAMNNPKMHFAWNTMVHAFKGEGHLDTVELKHLKSGELKDYKVDTCFEFIGYIPNTEIFKDKINLDRQGYVSGNALMETSVPGVFVAGDVRDKELKQVATAVGDGAIAGVGAEKYIADCEVFEQQIMQTEKPGFIYVYSAIDDPSRELLPMMSEIERSYKGKVKMSVIDIYKSKRLCDRLVCNVEPMTLFYTLNGELVATETDCDRPSIEKRLDKLLANV